MSDQVGNQNVGFLMTRHNNVICQVWSSDAGQTHSPPSDLVMKGQTWFVADEMKTVLLKDDLVSIESSNEEVKTT